MGDLASAVLGETRAGDAPGIGRVDPARERVLSVATHHMNVDYSCFEGLTVRGLPEVVLQRGEILVENGAFLSAPGRGRFLRRARFQPP